MATFALVPSINADGILTTNAAELSAAVKQELKKYSYIVTDDNYRDAKDDRAKLNSIATQLAESRKHIENEVFATWKKDKAQIMGIEKDLKEASSALGEGIKAIDDEAKMRKAQALEGYWNSMGGNKFPFAKVLADHKSWMNKTAKKADTEAEMDQLISVLTANETTLNHHLAGLAPEHQAMVLEKFYDNMDLPAALRDVERIRQTLARIEEERRRAAHPEPQRAPEPQPIQQEMPMEAPAIQPSPVAQSADPEPLIRRAFLIDGTKEQILALAQAMKQIGIQILDIRGKGESLPERLAF